MSTSIRQPPALHVRANSFRERLMRLRCESCGAEFPIRDGTLRTLSSCSVGKRVNA